eukprot:7166141-Prymnesium_polylepis.1
MRHCVRPSAMAHAVRPFLPPLTALLAGPDKGHPPQSAMHDADGYSCSLRPPPALPVELEGGSTCRAAHAANPPLPGAPLYAAPRSCTHAAQLHTRRTLNSTRSTRRTCHAHDYTPRGR